MKSALTCANVWYTVDGAQTAPTVHAPDQQHRLGRRAAMTSVSETDSARAPGWPPDAREAVYRLFAGWAGEEPATVDYEAEAVLAELLPFLASLIEARESAAVVRTLRDRAKYHHALVAEYRGVNATAHTVHLVLAGDYDGVADAIERLAAGVSREATP